MTILLYKLLKPLDYKCYHHELCDNELQSHHREFIARHFEDNINAHYLRISETKKISTIQTDPNGVGCEENPQHKEGWVC
jgi:hypothetical protein